MEASCLHTPHRLSSAAAPRRSAHPESWAVQLRWFAMAAVVGFVVPYGSSALELDHDLYLAIYFVAVLALCAAYVAATGLDVRAVVGRRCTNPLGSIADHAVMHVSAVARVRDRGPAAPTREGALMACEGR